MRAGLLAIVLLAFPPAALARPTHSDIRPLPAGAELNGLDVFPIDLGRTWIFRDSTGRRYGARVVRAMTGIDKHGKPHSGMVCRDAYELAATGEKPTKATEHWAFQADSELGVLSWGGAETDRLEPLLLPEPMIEMPRHLTNGSGWIAGIAYRFVGVADIEVEAGSFKGCAVVDGIKEHRLTTGELTDTRTFYCPGVGRVATLVMALGTWRPADELEKWSTMPAAKREKVTMPKAGVAGSDNAQPQP